MRDVEFNYDKNGVTAPEGFRAAGVHAGFRKDPKRLDAALVVSDGPDTVACGMFTKSVFCAAPVQVDRELLAQNTPRAVLLNSGNANAATGEPGLTIARKAAQVTAHALGLPTGVIGVELPWAPFETGIPALVEALSKDGGHDAACAIMTTDTHPKEHAVRFVYDGNEYAVGGMVKGSGMIQPDMATMLAVITTDMPIAPANARLALQAAVDVSFNKVTVDSDTSTNDSVFFFSSGMGAPVADAGEAADVLAEALRVVCEDLARQIAADGEGATKLVTVFVRDAANEADADKAAEKLKYVRFAAAYCSDTSRAQITAKRILDVNEEVGNARPVLVSDMHFREQCYGYFEGQDMSLAWTAAGGPHGAKDYNDIVAKYGLAATRDFLKEADPFHDAESDAEYWARVHGAFSLIASNPDLKDGDDVLQISHGNTLLSLMHRFAPEGYDLSERPANGSVTCLDFDTTKPFEVALSVVSYNQ